MLPPRARTPQGLAAYELLDWARQDPDQRTATALARVRAMSVPGPAALELGDVATILGRMLRPGRRISDQVPASAGPSSLGG